MLDNLNTETTTDADGNPVETQTFVVPYRMTVYNNVRVIRPVNITREDLLLSIDKDDIVNGDCEVSWDDVKDAWRDNAVAEIYNEEYDEIL